MYERDVLRPFAFHQSAAGAAKNENTHRSRAPIPYPPAALLLDSPLC
jgi:hypothetical protein